MRRKDRLVRRRKSELSAFNGRVTWDRLSIRETAIVWVIQQFIQFIQFSSQLTCRRFGFRV